MSKNSARSFYIRNVNTHLLNVLENSYYIEIGAVKISVLDRLLKGEILDLKEIVHLMTLNEGIGNITNDLENDYNYQLNYLLSYRQKSSTHKFFLTAGLLKYRDETGLEKFAPVVLIPIDIDYQRRKIHVSSEPILNRLLMRLLAKYKYNTQEEQSKYIDVQSSTRLNSSFAIDKICYDLADHFKLTVTPVNYLTVCNVEYYDFDIKKDFFSPERSIFEIKEVDLYNEYFKKVKAILPANLHQKHAIMRAHNGENFAVDGKLGSGKTYTAINIIADAISNDKKILYVNQDLDNLWEVEKNMKRFGLDNLVVNLTTKTTNVDVEEIILPENIQTKFNNETIEYFANLDKARHERINGFTFDYLIENQAMLKNEYPNLEEIKLESYLPRYEYSHVKKLLIELEENIKRIGNFSDNVWRGLQYEGNKITPITSSDILTRLDEFYNFHRMLTKTVSSFCKTYNLKEPSNIHSLHKLLEHVLSFESAKPQPSWKTKEDRVKARFVLREIQEAIDEYYNALDYYKNTVNDNYKQGRMLDILTDMLGKNLSITNDQKFINNLLANNNELDRLTNTILENAKIATKEFNHLNSYFGFNTLDLVSTNFLKDMLVYLKVNSFPRSLTLEYINNKNKALLIGSIVSKNYKVIKEIKDAIKPIQIANVKFSYVDAKDIISDPKAKKKMLTYFDNALIRKYSIDKEDLFKKINDYVNASNNIIDVLNTKDIKNDIEKYWQECTSFYDLVDKYPQFSKNIEIFLKKQTSIAPLNINTVTSTLATLIKCIEDADTYIRDLKKYNIIIDKEYPIEKLNQLSHWTVYLVKVINLRKEVYNSMKKKNIKINDIIDLIEQDNNYLNLLAKMNENEPEYIRLLGENYNRFDTVLGDTGICIDHFDNFIEYLQDPNDIDELFSKKKFEKFLKDSMQLRTMHSDWFGYYRTFSVCFIHGQAYCQTANFKEVLSFLNDFIKQEDQIQDVMNIINALSQIKDYGLISLVDAISSGELTTNLSQTFRYTMYNKYINEFKDKYPILLDTRNIKTMFEAFEENEQNFCLNNIISLKRLANRKNKSKNINAEFFEYSKFIDGTIKYHNLYLSDLSIFNSNIDVSKFDLVIVDDCHLSSANKYNRIAFCKQVILLGDKTFQSSVSNSLLQRIGDYSIVQFANRYTKMSPKFNNVWNNSNKYIYSYDTTVCINQITSIQDLCERVVKHFLKNPNNFVNVLIGNEETRRDIYMTLVSILNMSYSYMDVIEILTYHIRILNVNEEGAKYVNDVFIYYTDFIEYDQSQINLIFRNFVVVENSIQIFYLAGKADVNKLVEQSINKTMSKAIVKAKSSDGVAKMLQDDLIENGIKVKTGFGKFDITIQKSSKHPIAILFEGSNINNTFSIIDDYHYYYRQYQNRKWDIKIIYIYDLIDNYNKVLNELLEEINMAVKH